MRISFLLFCLFSLGVVAATPMRRSSPRSFASIAEPPTRRVWTLGLITGLGGIWGEVPGYTTASKGLHYSFGFATSYVALESVRFRAALTYQMFRLGRTLDSGTAVMVDPSKIQFSQSVKYLGVGFFGGLNANAIVPTNSPSVNWWWELGFEYNHPLSATQTSDIEGDVSISNPDRVLLLATGPTATIDLKDAWNLEAGIQGIFNVAATGGSRVYGGRLLVALLHEM